jgi:hypothetical protein
MAKLDHYRRRIEFSTIQAELSASDEVRQTWLQIRESYRQLLRIETEALGDRDLDLNSLWLHNTVDSSL